MKKVFSHRRVEEGELMNSSVLLFSATLILTQSASAAEKFPSNFKWCVATAAHQIEGNNFHNDWWTWEKTPGRVKNNEHSGEAVDHWNRVNEDVKLMKDINVTDYRFSVEWARIEPRENEIDSAAIKHYREEVKELLRQGIRPMVTLHHFTFPQWLREKGGWEWSQTPAAFERFTEIVFTQIAPEAEQWVTVNEPMVNILGGYYLGLVPPSEKRSMQKIKPVFVGLLKSHVAAYQRLHALASQQKKKIRVGMAHHLRVFGPYQKWNPIDKYLARLIDQGWNWALPESLKTGVFKFQFPLLADIDETIPGLKNTQDFVGVNYYTGDLIHLSLFGGIKQMPREELEKTDLNWDIDPEGFRTVLKNVALKFPGETVTITENGLADATDAKRPRYLVDHLRVVHDMIQTGQKIDGYCYWSLMDNFEWIEGFHPRFGLYAVDYATQKRTARPSALLFGEIAKTGQLPLKSK